VKRVNEYDNANRLVGISERDSTGALLVYFKYGYDADGRLTTRYRLPMPQAITTASVDASYDADNRISNWNSLTLTNDVDGNMTFGPLGSAGLVNYSYDARNRLTSVGSVAAGITSYGYDAENNRISVTTQSGTTRYLIDPHGDALPRVLVREKPDDSKTAYVYGIGLLYEVNDTTDVATYYHFDSIGNTAALTGATGAVTDRIEYSPYGQITYRTGTTDTPFLYVGQLGVQQDANGLLNMRARYYSPELMRFVNADPIGFSGGMNWYAYANNSPMMCNDPTGTIVETAWDVANVGLGIYSLQDNVRNGNWGWAALDAVGLAYDSLAVAVPFLPAGVSAAFKASRAGNTVIQSVNAGIDIARTSDRVHDAARGINVAKKEIPWQAAIDGSNLHRKVASQSDSLRYFDSTFMTGANRSSGRRPDMIGSGIWADITTPGQWQRHVTSYTTNFGTGIPILYNRGVGVVGTTRLIPGVGYSLFTSRFIGYHYGRK
jgi:RHS repeat-associated protein